MKPLIRVVQEPTRTLAIKTGKGYVHAITFAKGMTAADVQASFILNPPTERDWRPFNESTGEYL